MDDTTTPTQTTEEKSHEWQSNGGCPRCDALDGHVCHEDDVVRPHPRCDCTIVDRGRSTSGCDGSFGQVAVEYRGNSHHGGSAGAADEEFDMIFDFTIRCPEGAAHFEGEIFVSMTYGEVSSSEDALDEAYDEAFDRALEIAEQECPACDPPRVS